jgi:histidinol-phosphate aminotransferase
MRFNENLEDLKVYEAGKPIELVVREFGIEPKEVVKLASNENPNGTSPKVVEAVRDFATKIYLYPDDSYFELKGALASKFSIDEKNIILGAGSDQVLEFATKAKLKEGDKVLMNKVTFAMYEIYAKVCGAEIIRTDGLLHNAQQFKTTYDKLKPAIVFICVPNNPLGECMTRAEVYDILSHLDEDTLAIVDCAYMEYAAYKNKDMLIEPRELISKFSNAVYLGTFSKAYGLGGMRVGYGIGEESVIKAFYKVRPPFNVANLSALAALAALKDEEFVRNSVEQNFEEMKRYEEFAIENGIETIDSYTNFITYFFKNKSSKEVADALLKKGIIVRDLTSYALNGIRITIGSSTQNDRFFEEFKKVQC